MNWFDSDTVRDAASASGRVDRLPMMLSFEAASVDRPTALGPWGGFIRAFGLDG
jgi:hypothetical protein